MTVRDHWMRRFITLAAMISIMSGLGLTMIVLDAMDRGQWPDAMNRGQWPDAMNRGQWPDAEAVRGQTAVRLDLSRIPLRKSPAAPPKAPTFGRSVQTAALGIPTDFELDRVIAGESAQAELSPRTLTPIEDIKAKPSPAPVEASPVQAGTPSIAVTKVRLGDLRDRGLLVIDVEGEPVFEHRMEEDNRTLVVALEGAKAAFDAGAVNKSRLVEMFQTKDTPGGLELRLASLGQLEVLGAAYLPASTSRGPRLAVEFRGDGTTAEGEPMPDNEAIRLYQDLDGRAVFVANEKETVIGSNSL
ncbi:MAG: hypothetical protein ACPGOV_08345 [Magnetovibrionaceae bacterium]